MEKKPMRTVRLSFATASFALAAVISASSVTLLAQAPAKSNIGTPPDGGVRQVLESIFIPPKPNAPFTLTLDTEWTRPLGNGGTYTLVNERHIARTALAVCMRSAGTWCRRTAKSSPR